MSDGRAGAGRGIRRVRRANQPMSVLVPVGVGSRVERCSADGRSARSHRVSDARVFGSCTTLGRPRIRGRQACKGRALGVVPRIRWRGGGKATRSAPSREVPSCVSRSKADEAGAWGCAGSRRPRLDLRDPICCAFGAGKRDMWGHWALSGGCSTQGARRGQWVAIEGVGPRRGGLGRRLEKGSKKVRRRS